MHLLTQNVVVVLQFLVRGIFVDDLDKFLEELLAVGAAISNPPRLDVLLNQLPVLLIHSQTL